MKFLIKTLTEVLSLWLPPATCTMSYVGINGCNQYTNWYGVYHVVPLYAPLCENNIIDGCSSQSVLFSLINLVNKVPSILFVDSIYPFP
jgi:hypothetical protein